MNTLSSKCPMAPPKLIATSLPITCAATIVMASHCVGFTLPGMIDEPGSLSGIWISPIPLRGPEDNIRISFAIFIRLTATVLSAPCDSTMASCAASASNLFSAVMNGKPVKSAMCLATFSEYPFGVLIPVPTAVPPNANSDKCAKVFFIARKP